MEKTDFNQEKVQSLIDKLQSLIASNAEAAKLLTVSQLLVAELQHTNNNAIIKRSVAVVMPSFITTAVVETNTEATEKEVHLLQEEPIAEIIEQPAPESEDKEIVEEKEITVSEKDARKDGPLEQYNPWEAFGFLREAPTIVHQAPVEENAGQELNEKYKSDKSELIETLQSTPITDLTNAVGINDRYVYINDLFRGDEFMYERSIITLNKFNDYEQARGWAERELYLKLGWDLTNPVVKQFEHLIKRRFR
ncbi:hypothetical protein [Arachidicoccus ginsenosidimutans]|uniref:hypothetical protein n=1 Tax=Arachidicoccus sp. BS20 TaxID=1850526 RepID=UPI0012E78BBE|nr:hypothetical protein [Arachidicoccus sp. BS20]